MGNRTNLSVSGLEKEGEVGSNLRGATGDAEAVKRPARDSVIRICAGKRSVHASGKLRTLKASAGSPS
jgi:putative heme iron utilization protein